LLSGAKVKRSAESLIKSLMNSTENLNFLLLEGKLIITQIQMRML